MYMYQLMYLHVAIPFIMVNVMYNFCLIEVNQCPKMHTKSLRTSKEGPGQDERSLLVVGSHQNTLSCSFLL